MSVSSKEDFNGAIAMLANLANEKGLSTGKMISVVENGKEGIKSHFEEITKKPIIEEHKSMLDEFQL